MNIHVIKLITTYMRIHLDLMYDKVHYIHLDPTFILTVEASTENVQC